MAHGCSHSATDWFPPSADCPQCLGLPEETTFTDFVLNQRFIAISISSSNRQRKCWRPQIDLNPVKDILSKFKSEHQIESLPLYAFGASSGGAFVGAMAMNQDLVGSLNLKGVIVQIMAVSVDPNAIRESLAVPVMYIPMVKDGRTLEAVHEQMDFLKDSLSTMCEVKALPIDSLYFHHRIGGRVTAEISKKIYGGFKENGYLDDEDLLKEDPRRSDWREIVKKSVGLETLKKLKDSLIGDESAISEEMNVAFSFHELTTQCNQEMMQFIESIEKKAG